MSKPEWWRVAEAFEASGLTQKDFSAQRGVRMVLGAQFNSFLHPVTVLTILPLSVAGAAFALLATGSTLNIFSMIGLLLLMGIVKKNSSILVDYALQERERGADAFQAMLRAGPVRLRPILMTSTATMMAAVPAALALARARRRARPCPSPCSAACPCPPCSACWWCPPSTSSRTG
nr:efflux RND transporter permease subunit [Myxococcus xanthus]